MTFGTTLINYFLPVGLLEHFKITKNKICLQKKLSIVS